MLLELPIRITDRALEEAKYIYQHKNIPSNYSLRIGMRSGGCGVAGFFIGFDQPNDKDETFECQGINILIDKRHVMYLFDQELDFEDREDERGFVFNKISKAAQVK